jgi:hypothetical protein
LALLVADADIAAGWKGVENGANGTPEESDWDRLREALRDDRVCAPVAVAGREGAVGLQLGVGQGIVQLFRIERRLVLCESFFHSDYDDLEDDDRELFHAHVAALPRQAKRVGRLTVASGRLVLMPSTDACPDVAKLAKRKAPAADAAVQCGSEDAGLLVALPPGKYQLLVEGETKGAWGSGARAHIVPTEVSPSSKSS